MTSNPEIGLSELGADAYSNFAESVRSPETLRGYRANLERFLGALSDDVFEGHGGGRPASRGLEDLAASFVAMARADPEAARNAVRAYVRGLKRRVEAGTMNPNTVPNMIKPVKSLLASNEVAMPWKAINKMFPPRIRTGDRAYTREEIARLLASATSLASRAMVLVFASSGIRVGAWDYLCWKDYVPLLDAEERPEGAALRVYTGHPEEYWTFLTPEACGAVGAYRAEWRARFGRDPAGDDPLLVAAHGRSPARLRSHSVRIRVARLVERAGLRVRGGGGQCRDVKLDHGFRKFFNTMLRRANVEYVHREEMMGHKVGLEAHYTRYEDDARERFPEYRKAIGVLTISDEERLREDAHRKQDTINALRQSVRNSSLRAETAARRAAAAEEARALREDGAASSSIAADIIEAVAAIEPRPDGLAAGGKGAEELGRIVAAALERVARARGGGAGPDAAAGDGAGARGPARRRRAQGGGAARRPDPTPRDGPAAGSA